MLFGVDNNLLARALEGDVFEAYESPGARRGRPGARPRPRAPRDADRPRRRLPELRQGVVRRAWDRAAGRPGRPDPGEASRPARRREPGDLYSGACLHARHDRVPGRPVAGLLAWTACERRPRRRRLGGRVLRALLRFGREQGEAPDRRLLRLQPAGGGDLSGPAACRGADRSDREVLLPTDRARRSPARREERRGSARADRLHALAPLPGGHPTADVRLPCAERRRASARVRAVRGRRRSRRSSSRPRRSRRTESAGWTSGRTSWFAERPRLARGDARHPARLPRAVLPLSARGDRRARPARSGRPAGRRPHRSVDAGGRLVHGVAGACVDDADDRRRAPRRVRPRPLPVSRAQPRQRARRRAVRAADRCRRARLPRDPPRRHRARLGADPDRARVLQRRRGRADRRDVLGEPRSAGRRGRGDARRIASCSST